MAQMMQQQSDNPAESARNIEAMSSNQTLEINPSHNLIIQLNELRKNDQNRAKKVSQSLIDQVLIQSGIPIDT
jgi:HSP90 family molecular chaperone